jgi:tetratricopeptide (TPR) repeat protein
MILAVAQARHPLDFDVTFDLALGHHLEAVRASEKQPAQAEPLMRTAVGHYRTARALRPDHPTALTNLGMLLNLLNEPGAAVPVLREAVKHHPSDPVAQFNLGGALLATNDLDGAESAFRKTVELSPNYALAHNNLGIVLQRLRRPQEAAQQFQQAAKLAPNDPTVQTNFAILIANSGKPDDALGILAKVLAAHPKFAPAHFGRGVALRHKKDDGWKAEFREAMALDPKGFGHLAKDLGEESKKDEPKKEPEPKKTEPPKK